jgi:hypothetical protein
MSVASSSVLVGVSSVTSSFDGIGGSIIGDVVVGVGGSP